MSLPGLFKSRSQRRLFICFSLALVGVFFIITLEVARAGLTPKWLWDTVNNLLLSLIASGVFAIFSMLFIKYFLDPDEAQNSIVIAPQDLKSNMDRIANEAKDYKIYVRSGRYFRSKTLPKLIEQARSRRRPINIEVVLLDFRDEPVCDLYTRFRKDSSFDADRWSADSTRAEILATISAVAQAAIDNRSLMTASLYLSSRLSIFRIEGSSDELMVTREDPKDFAYKFHHKHRDHAAYMNEFRWIRDTASLIDLPTVAPAGNLLATIFGNDVLSVQLEEAVTEALKGKAPYVT